MESLDFQDLFQLTVFIATVIGGVIYLERRLTRIETLLERCPHVESRNQSKVVF